MKDQENAQKGPGWATFPHRRNYSRGIGDVWGPQKIKGGQLLLCYKYRTSLEVGNNCGKPKKSKHFLFSPIPTRTLESSLDDSKGNMEEIGDKYERSGKCTKGTRLSFISPEKKLFQGYWKHPSRTLKLGQVPMWPGHHFSINHRQLQYYINSLIYVLELMSNDLIWFDPSEKICLIFHLADVHAIWAQDNCISSRFTPREEFEMLR